jgi:hypothetical protein
MSSISYILNAIKKQLADEKIAETINRSNEIIKNYKFNKFVTDLGGKAGININVVDPDAADFGANAFFDIVQEESWRIKPNYAKSFIVKEGIISATLPKTIREKKKLRTKKIGFFNKRVEKYNDLKKHDLAPFSQYKNKFCLNTLEEKNKQRFDSLTGRLSFLEIFETCYLIPLGDSKLIPDHLLKRDLSNEEVKEKVLGFFTTEDPDIEDDFKIQEIIGKINKKCIEVVSKVNNYYNSL